MSVATGLSRKSMGGGMLFTVAVTASSPMTVLAGGLVATFAGTGVVAVGLSFVVIAVGLAPMAVAYVSVARRVPHPATAYAVVALGLGRPVGVAAGAVAILSYLAIGTSLFGLLGVVLVGLLGGMWWVWALVAWVLVAVLGVSTATVSARALAVLLTAQLAVLVGFDWTGFTHPADGVVSLTGLDPGRLFVDGIGGVVALGVAAFVGFETGTAYAEEARTGSTVVRATLAALFCLGGLYAVSAWAMTVAVGPEAVVAAAQDPAGGLPFGVIADRFGLLGSAAASAVLVAAILAAMVSFHHGVARYVFALGRERVLPAGLAKVGFGRRRRGGAPVAASVLVSLVALVVIVVVAVSGADPVRVLFTGLSTVAAVGVLALLVTCSWAARQFFRKGLGRNESRWVKARLPRLGVVTGVVMLGVLVGNVHTLLGVAWGSGWMLLPPTIVAAVALLGLVWAGWLRRHRPDAYVRIGQGTPHPLAVPDARLADLPV